MLVPRILLIDSAACGAQLHSWLWWDALLTFGAFSIACYADRAFAPVVAAMSGDPISIAVKLRGAMHDDASWDLRLKKVFPGWVDDIRSAAMRFFLSLALFVPSFGW